MHDPASELRRIPLPRTWVNKGERNKIHAVMSRYESLLERAKWGKFEQDRLSEEELAMVAEELRKPAPETDPFTLLDILGHAFAFQYRELVERFLECEDDPMLARLALQILCGYWGNTDQYLEEVLRFMRGRPWDQEEDVRQIAISEAGEYLRSNTEPRFLHELIYIFESEDEERSMREGAYFALARAVGRDWKDLPSAASHFDLVTQTDPAVIQEAKERLRRETDKS
jgi:hypothetical protein